MQQEYNTDNRDDNAFLNQGAFQRLHGRMDLVRAILDRHDFDSFRQAGFHVFELVFDIVDNA